MDMMKSTSEVEKTLSTAGVWTNVLGCSKLDGQPGIWLEVADGNSYYYNPSSEIMQNFAFTACSNLEKHQVRLLIPQNAPAAGLIVTSKG